ncbi:hypothetical protein PIB30_106061, partial [Stylosanthes scabra]|nr:hypothetical protein [Stylosanthes scabra]
GSVEKEQYTICSVGYFASQYDKGCIPNNNIHIEGEVIPFPIPPPRASNVIPFPRQGDNNNVIPFPKPSKPPLNPLPSGEVEPINKAAINRDYP